MRNLTLHKFLAMLLMTVSSATLSVAQNVAQIGTKGYARCKPPQMQQKQDRP